MPDARKMAWLLAVAWLGTLAGGAEPEPPSFEVTRAPGLHADSPINARVYVMLSQRGAAEPRLASDLLNPQPILAVDARDWRPGTVLRIGTQASAFPGPLASLKPGTYRAQGVVRLNLDTHQLGNGEGNAYGPVAEVEIGPERRGVVTLTVDRVVPPRALKETERIKLVAIDSPLLSAFYHRPIRLHAAVILPKGDPEIRRAALYVVPGFGGDHRLAPAFLKEPRLQFGTSLIRVILDPDCGNGHHVFADSATNGPRGRALIEELVPHIEKTFPVIAEPRARVLAGHSSGGWSSLWLQVTYPDVFGGVWSTAPDSVDFRDFQKVDVYAPDVNLFRDARGERRPIIRFGGRPVRYYDELSRLEDVIGDGGQLHSFEAVFSPLASNGRPRPLWDRTSGAIDPATAKAWEPYDIRLVLERNWPSLGPKLRGKLHVIAAEHDNFYLTGAVRLLKASLERLGSDAVLEVAPGKDHLTLRDAKLAARIDREICATVESREPGKLEPIRTEAK